MSEFLSARKVTRALGRESRSMAGRFDLQRRMIAAGVTLGLTVSSWSLAGASEMVKFSPNAHRAALIRVLDTHAAMGSRIDELKIVRSPVNGTWVYYRAGLRTSGGEDLAEGYAHWANGMWLIVYGPWSEGCGPLTSLTRIPVKIRRSFVNICK
jgi:hypothetical protein